MNTKNKLLKSKWLSNNKAHNYNTRFSPPHLLDTPDLETIRQMQLEDAFWNMGSSTHPEEPWAVNTSIQEGMKAYLLFSHSQEELRRIAWEARQAIKWGVSKCQPG
ncbi:uncharacterized protein PGTG_12397 [Puccinia graminis f. sp. tritici CRL 75-36-700-3]|uniref:Uncharacterized protein n=1 Tax=Puccinia graminis f. sp. tritici (strain CRL 75-36-700-3 / race SCCL) TaxID=418459 RepID=E3KQ66_PUCGT|nr:uncharacterized protein PGTG_12397 [Puccinia graminis f. sp. tritici CRL 75-36-700-3]EFP86441.2 hypothetical protein PGTG_12397 [Puccinia graminis f. sp. tritici CRL 75-36-700-3]